MTIDYAARARALVGTRFRPQGRGEGGLDCVGVVVATFGLPPVRNNYLLRGDYLDEIRKALNVHFRRVSRTHGRAGDLMVLQPGARQVHMAVRTEHGFVHADARIRRVVETPGEPPWLLLGTYRKRRSN